MLTSLIFILAGWTCSAKADSVFVVHSYAPNTWTAGLDAGIAREAARTKLKVETYHYHAEFWKTQSRDSQKAELQKILEKAKNPEHRGFILADDEAAEGLREEILKLGKPVLFTGINHAPESAAARQYCSSSPKSIALLERYPFPRAVDTLQKLMPKLQRIAVVASAAPTSDAYIAGLQEELASRGGHIKIVKTVRSSDWETWKSELSGIKDQADVVWALVPYGVKDRLNEQISPSRIAAWMKSNVTTLSIGEVTLGDGVDVTVGLGAASLGEESVALFRKLASGQALGCPLISQHFKIQVKKRR